MNLSQLASALGYAAAPAIAATVGAAIATRFPPRATVRSYIQHLAAGVVFSVVSVELLPDITHRHLPVSIAVGFVLGVVAMLGLKTLTEEKEAIHEEGEPPKTERTKPEPTGKAPTTMLWGVGIDVALDGLLIALSFAAGARAGKLLTLALTVEMFSLGLALAVSLHRAGVAKGRAVRLCAMIFLLLPVGTLLGALVLPLLSGALMEGVLSFGLAALLYLVTEELLVEAHREGETPLATALFFLGFLVFLLLGMSAG